MNSPTQRPRLPATGPPGAESSFPAELGVDFRARIGRQLRSMHSEVIGQGVPDRFAKILRGLDDPTVGERDEG
jgi:Anti-sigma factor NepR